MKLKSFGCSFVYGNDLSDCLHGVGKHNPPPSNFSWPALIAKKLGLEYQCFARPGSSNLQILETILSEIDQAEDDVFLINWTWIERFGYFNEEVKKKNGVEWNQHGWVSILPSDDTSESEMYYRYLHSQMRDKLETLICIKSAIDSLKENDKKFLMTFTDPLIWETQWHTTDGIQYLQTKISPYVKGFDDQGFIDWAMKMKFEISNKMHPLEDAHQAAADLFIDAIRRII